MKSAIKWMIVFVIFLFLNKTVNATTCSQDELNRLKNLADKVELAYSYDLKENKTNIDDIHFAITATNLNKDLKVIIENDYLAGDYREFKNTKDNSGSLTGFYSGQNVSVMIRAYVANDCVGKALTVKKISIPYFNTYAIGDARCQIYPEFKYCKGELLEKNISAEKFEKELAEYLKNQNREDEKQSVEEENDYLLIIIMSSVGLLLVIIIVVIIVRRYKKNVL